MLSAIVVGCNRVDIVVLQLCCVLAFLVIGRTLNNLASTIIDRSSMLCCGSNCLCLVVVCLSGRALVIVCLSPIRHLIAFLPTYCRCITVIEAAGATRRVIFIDFLLVL